MFACIFCALLSLDRKLLVVPTMAWIGGLAVYRLKGRHVRKGGS